MESTPFANYKIYCPVDCTPYVNQDDFTGFRDAVKDVVSCSERIPFVRIKGQTFYPKIYWHPDYLPRDLKVTRGMHNCLVFELQLPLKYPIDERKEKEFFDKLGGGMYHESRPQDSSELGNKWYNADRFVYQGYYFLATLQMAHPCMFHSAKMEVYIDDNFFYYGVTMSNFLYDPWEHTARDWPQLRSIEVETVWKWLSHYKIDFLHKSNSRAGRSVLAVIQIFSTKDYSVSHHLMWAMNGIEAIYKTQDTYVQKQIVERSQMLLGSTDALNTTVKQLYNFRSRYAHGELDMFPLYHEADIQIKTVNDYYRQFSGQIRLAIRLLIASIQELVVQNKIELAFPPIRKGKKRKSWPKRH